MCVLTIIKLIGLFYLELLRELGQTLSDHLLMLDVYTSHKQALEVNLLSHFALSYIVALPMTRLDFSEM